MAEKLINPLPAALFPQGADGNSVFQSAASIGEKAREPVPAAAQLRDFAEEVTRIFHKAKRAALEKPAV